MAFTLEILEKSVFGNKRVNVISCSVDSASGNIDTGLSVIDWVSWSPISMTTAAMVVKKNLGSGATARPGIVNINAATTGDVFTMVAYGK